ncbi:MAG TPA: hypothetical protein VE443_06235 [Beijerinckiaceae bacterium]|jgi:hypothetical protein|nr:hypothetical protein [Microvirga sp.]HZB37582.1 hypothetical protein [Beijerinckiaceae bacterium]
MSRDPRDEAAPDGLPASPTDAERLDTALPPPVQEHLGQQLRATYQQITEKPAFLGDPALPPRFEHHIQQIENRERAEIRVRAHDLGVEAVEAALQDIAAGATGPDEPTPPVSRPSGKR